MGHFVEATEVREVRAPDWDEGETVTIKRFSFGDRQFLMGAAMGNSARVQKGDVAVSVDIEHMNLAILQRGIVRWTLKRADGSIAPLNKESIASLTERDAEFILGEIQRYNPSTDEDSKNA
jgi:hypothetical protein